MGCVRIATTFRVIRRAVQMGLRCVRIATVSMSFAKLGNSLDGGIFPPMAFAASFFEDWPGCQLWEKTGGRCGFCRAKNQWSNGVPPRIGILGSFKITCIAKFLRYEV